MKRLFFLVAVSFCMPFDPLCNKSLAEIKPLCADFAAFPQSVDLPNPLTLSDFTFKKIIAEDKWSTTNKYDKELGLRFDPSGFIVELPVPVQKVSFRLLVNNDSVHIAMTDRLGVSKSDFPHSDWADHQLEGNGIVSLLVTGGGFEGALGKLCTTVFISGEL
jgi:hypothetical protein